MSNLNYHVYMEHQDVSRWKIEGKKTSVFLLFFFLLVSSLTWAFKLGTGSKGMGYHHHCAQEPFTFVLAYSTFSHLFLPSSDPAQAFSLIPASFA